ncbi:hypothetical protein M2222_008318 [Bradyrhizobium elkanii]|uniref:hypothetical protein n=1 Tax=Bradyrhizobium elkanii TaxID=29448 RepID=UPI002169E0D0|nr:hypothetical protein [Bradyrhizobium elkanii]MCS3451905.1 hypothetical protein [Bradyrhizobium elkanii]MCS3565996.1 hypothetical protein [Bradyrhizobium elkanii]MCW2153274.1 hypothetical protein [Bradyrhizobium elkanii]MCW2377007.1 hypothetical protein [Bradyrhizobium elkanii]
MRRLKRAALAVLLCIQPMTVRAEAVSVPNDWSLTIDRPIQQIITHYGLSKHEAQLATKAAAGFAYVGMCRGVGFSDAMGAISLIMHADPDVPYQAASLAILGVYTRSAFGRQSSAECAKIYEDATK